MQFFSRIQINNRTFQNFTTPPLREDSRRGNPKIVRFRVDKTGLPCFVRHDKDF
ncbi:hypothetical protein [Stenoxybacter acetivorans]|uniref:hypothetical protein n=1 Tax=Stenoxybacter acetivorans TaxID=422441 RepID=UPI0012EC95CB|nr:hypothetical protein [Stenoxybacter acetivorans]